MGHQMELCIMWNFKETERQNVGTGVGGDGGLGRMGTTGSTPKYFNGFWMREVYCYYRELRE